LRLARGVDDTYKLFLQANDENKFRLWGRVNFNQGGTPPNRSNPNALGLLSGTVVIGNFVTIENLRSNSSNYDVDSDARIIVDGGKLLAPSGRILAIVLYGNLTVENGELLAYGTAGVTIRESGTLEIHGGEAKLYILRTSVIGGIHRGAYVQTGGTVTIDGTGGEAEHYRFSLPFPTNSFTMRGGTLNILNPKSGGVGDMGGILIGADKDNVFVDGGTVNATINRAKNFIINSSAPFYNLNLNKTVSGTYRFILAPHPGTAVTVPSQAARPLEIINTLTIIGTNTATLDLNGYKAIVHGDMIIGNGAQFIGAGSHLSFTGERDSKFDMKSTTALFNVDTLSLQKESSGYQLGIFHAGESTITTALQINNYLKVEKGNLNYRLFSIHLKGDLFLADSIAESVEPGRLVMNGSVQQNITVPVNNTIGFIGHLEIDNTFGVILQESSLPMVEKLTLTNGIFNIRNFGLTLNGPVNGVFSVSNMIATSGNHSDAGLIRKINADGLYVFPVGSVKGSKTLFSKLEATYNNVLEDVWVQFNPVASELATLNNELTNQALRYYWRIRHSSVTNKPQVNQYRFFFDPSTLPSATPPPPFVPGKIVDFVRSHEVVTNIDLDNSILIFDSGFDLEQGEYTAAQEDKFAGAVKLFYSRGNNSWASPANWSDLSTWSTDSHTGDIDGTLPQSGDIVQIGYSGTDYHVVKISSSVQIGGLRFKSETGIDNPGLVIENITMNVQLGNVSGRGSIAMNLGTTNPNLVADLGGFIDEINSNFIYQVGTTGTFTIPSVIDVYPDLTLKNTSVNSAIFNLPAKDITVKGNFHIRKGITAQLSSGAASADIDVLKNLILGESGTSNWGKLGFMATGLARTLHIQGDILIETAGSDLFAQNTTGSLTHKLQLEGNIIQSNGSISLFHNNVSSNKVLLELTGTSNGSYTRTGGAIPAFYRILMNKGSSLASTFTFASDFTLWNVASGPVKPIELANGILELQHTGIDVKLTEGTGSDFNIPSSAGLILGGATARASDSKGILLNGLLRLENTGKLLMTGSAYIEYGSTKSATLEVHDTAELTVASQIRGLLTFETGVLNYLQTGGVVTVGRFTAPNNTRGVFEVYREGSSFKFLDGELIMVRGHNNAVEASFVLDPSEFEIGENAVIQYGDGTNTPTSNTIAVKTAIPLPNMIINGNTGFNVKLQSEPLTIASDLEIAAGSTLNTNNLDLTLGGDFYQQRNF